MPNTPRKATNNTLNEAKSPAKRKGSPHRTGTLPKSPKKGGTEPSGSAGAPVTRSRSRSKPRSSLDNEPKSPSKPQIQCKVCNWSGKFIRLHLSKSPQCAAHYDLNALEAEANKRHRDLQAASMKQLRLTPEKREAETKTNKIYEAQHKEERNEKQRKAYEKKKEKERARKRKDYEKK